MVSENQLNALIGLAVVIFVCGVLGTGIGALVILTNGENVKVSGPCPALSASTLNNMSPWSVSKPIFQASWNRRLEVANSGGGSLKNGITITLENRCYNGMFGSAKLFVDDKLAAYSDGFNRMYDCQGKLIGDADYGFITGMAVYNDARTMIWKSGRPVAILNDKTTVRSQPSDAVALTIDYSLPKLTSTFTVTTVDATAPASDPRLVLLVLARALLLEGDNKSYDPCNSFVQVGGIIVLCILICLLAVAIFYIWKSWERIRDCVSRRVDVYKNSRL